MSMISAYEKEMTPTKVKAKERHDVDIDKLVKFGAVGLACPKPTFADLTQIPSSRGEAMIRLREIMSDYTQRDPEAVAQLMKLPLEQALEFINAIKPPAPTRDDLTTRSGQGLESNKNAQPATKAEAPAPPGKEPTQSPS